MDLEDYIEEKKDYNIGNVSSRKKADNFSLSRKVWLHILYSNPQLAESICGIGRLTDEEVKLIITLLDDVIQDNIYGVKVSEKSKQQAEEARETIINQNLRGSYP